MTRRIVVNKNISSSANTSSVGGMFDGRYGKQEIVIDNTVGSEGIWLINENGYLKKVEARPAVDITVYSGLTDDQIRDIVRDLAESDLEMQFAKQTSLNALENQMTERDNEIESQIIPEERIAEIAEEAASNAVQDLPTVSDENIANIKSVIELIRDNPDILEALQVAIDNHVLLSETQYAQLIETGHTVLDNGRTITYSDKVYYNIYEDGESPYDDEEGTIIDVVDEDGVSILQVTFNVDTSEDDVLLISGNATIETENDEPILVI